MTTKKAKAMTELKEGIDPYYRKQAKDLTNLLFDKGFLQPMLTRESVDWLEDYLAFIIQSQCNMAIKAALLTAKIKTHAAQTRGENNGKEIETQEKTVDQT